MDLVLGRPFGDPLRRKSGSRRRHAASPAAMVADVVQKLAGVQPVEKLVVAAVVQMATVAKVGHRCPVAAFVQDLPRSDFDQSRHVAAVSEQIAREPVREKAEVVLSVSHPPLDQVDDAERIVVFPEQVAGVQVAFAPGFVGALDELPVVEARAEAAGDRLRLTGALVVAEAVVGEAQGLWEQPTFAVVLGEERLDALIAVAGGGLDAGFEIVEGDERQDDVAEFRVFVLGTVINTKSSTSSG